MAELAVRVVLSLGVVLGLFWAMARFGSRRLGGGGRGLVRVRSRQALSRGSSVAVVEVGARVLVVGVSDAGVRLLTELDPQELGSSATHGAAGASGAPAAAVAAVFERSRYPKLRTSAVARSAVPAYQPPAETWSGAGHADPGSVPGYRPDDQSGLSDLAGYAGTGSGSDTGSDSDFDGGSGDGFEPGPYDAEPTGLGARRERRAQRRAARLTVAPEPDSALGGSILAGDTWRQAWAAALGKPGPFDREFDQRFDQPFDQPADRFEDAG